MNSIVLEHIWTRERKTVSVEHISEKEIFVFWPLAGTYRIDLKENTIRARSVKAQRRHDNIVPWRVVDILEVRIMVRNHLDGEDRKKKTEILARLHKASMPRGE